MTRPLLEIPAVARNANLTVRTFGPEPVLGVDWFPFGMMNKTPLPKQVEQLPDGSLYIAGPDGANFGAAMCTVRRVGGVMKGRSFRPPYVMRWIVRFQPLVDPKTAGKLPFLCLWALDAGQLNGSPPPSPREPGSFEWAEDDHYQYTKDGATFGDPNGLLNWAYRPLQGDKASKVIGQMPAPPHGLEVALIRGSDSYANWHEYMNYVQPATDSALGFKKFYFDGVEARGAVNPQDVTWKKYDGTKPFSACVAGDQLGACIENGNMVPIAGSCAGMPLWVLYFDVWQASGEQNLIY